MLQSIVGSDYAPLTERTAIVQFPQIEYVPYYGGVYKTGSEAFGYKVCIAGPARESTPYCGLTPCASTMVCRFGMLSVTDTESVYTYAAGGAYDSGWTVTFPETLETIDFNTEAISLARGNRLNCCPDMVLFMVTNLDTPTSAEESYFDDPYDIWVYKATVRIYLSIKGIINKSWEAKTVLIYAHNLANGSLSAFVDAGGYVSCECGLNIFEVYIGDKVHETGVYRGTTPTDYKWGICCGDNHLLVGEGTEGWHADITYPDPFDPLNPADLAAVTFRLDDGTECTVNQIVWDTVDEINMIQEPRIESFKFTDAAGEIRIIDPKLFIPYQFIKSNDYSVHALTRKSVSDTSNEFVSDDTLVDVVCWEHQYTDGANSVPTTTNSRSAAFLTSGTIDAEFVRTSEINVDTLGLGNGSTVKIANQIDDNNKQYANPTNSKTRQIHDIFEAYRQKSFERNHRRRGTYIRYNGTVRSGNGDFDSEGNLTEGIELDFDPHVSSTADAAKRLYIDDKEAWYRFDNLPGKSSIQEPPVGIAWNHPDKKQHRTAVWSGNGLLYIQHPQDAAQDTNVSTVYPNIAVDRFGNQYPCPSQPQTLAANVSYDSMEGVNWVEEKIEFAPIAKMTGSVSSPNLSGSGCGGCGKNISYS
jgi:hypothetical protein